MQFLVLFAVLMALISSEQASAEPVAASLQRLLIAVCCIVVVTLFARLAAVSTCCELQRGVASRDACLRRFQQLRGVHLVLWFSTVLIILFGLEWATLVRSNWRLAQTFLADELLILAPILLPLVLAWAAFYDVDRAIQLRSTRIAGSSIRPLSRLRYVVVHARHDLGLLLFPLLLAIVVHDSVKSMAPQLLADDLAWIVLLLPLAALFALFPWLLRCIWQTEPMAGGPLRRRLEELNRLSGVRMSEILVWHSSGMVVNAAVAGVISKVRCVFLSDGLLARLSDNEVAAVYAHELGHARHRHLLLRFLALVLPLPVGHGLNACFPWISAGLEAIVMELSGGALGPGMLALMLFGGYLMTAFAWYSRQLELQADLWACTALARQQDLNLVAAAEHFIGALSSLAPHRSRQRGGFLHPDLDRRVEFLCRATAHPPVASRFQRRWRRLARLLVTLTLVGIAVSLAGLGR